MWLNREEKAMQRIEEQQRYMKQRLRRAMEWKAKLEKHGQDAEVKFDKQWQSETSTEKRELRAASGKYEMQ